MTTNSDHRFGWTNFYMEFADKLLEHRDDRSQLVAKVRQVCNNLGHRFLDNSALAEEGIGLPDICPFTVMGSFNRGISDANRNKIAAELGEFLGVDESAPTSFEGVPILHAMNSVVFWDRDYIVPLWRVFADAIKYTDSGDEDAKKLFVDSYNQIKDAMGLGAKLTIGLFWIRPYTFAPLDSKSRQYITQSLKIGLPSSFPPPCSDYLELVDNLTEQFEAPNSPVHSFQELSLAAYEPANEDPTDPPQISVPPDGQTIHLIDRVAEAIPTQPILDRELHEYSLESIIADGCFLDEDRLKTILDRLKSKKSVILQGPPGTGKTWLAKKLAFALIGQVNSNFVSRFQFHPNMSYEDFIRGYRPDGDGTLNLVDGPFLEVAAVARRDSSNDYVVVIEEINRGNPAQIFGEMLTLLEADKREPSEALTLAYSKHEGERVHIPPNVYVIGTMNVADRSIAMVDLALRRRFAFVDLEPVFGEVWRNWVNDKCDIPLGFLESIEQRMISLNDQIAADRTLGPQFRIGHSYVTPPEDAPITNHTEWFRQVVETEIGPLLDEYWFDDTQKAESAKSGLLADL